MIEVKNIRLVFGIGQEAMAQLLSTIGMMPSSNLKTAKRQR